MKAIDILMMGGSTEIAGYGYLYNGYAATDANMFPANCSLPTEAEWTTLITYLGGLSLAGGKMKEVGFTHWTPSNNGATNSSGFTALPGGFRDNTGYFGNLQTYAYFIDSSYYWYGLAGTDFAVGKVFVGAKYGVSIRAIYTGANSTVTDYDGNVYDVITIGTQKWLKQNWKCTRLNNGNSIPNTESDATWAGLTTLGRCAYNNNPDNV